MAIAVRRFVRSTSAPATRENSSQGRNPSEASSEIATGSRVSVAANNGRAATITPSERFDVVLNRNNRQKGAPSRVRDVVAVGTSGRVTRAPRARSVSR